MVKFQSSILVLAFVTCIACVPSAANDARDIDLCQFELVFEDEFNDLAIAPRMLENGARWIAHTPWNGDFGDAIFIDPKPDHPFTTENGILRITASKAEDGRWRSGLISAADKSGAGQGVQYGYFEARMKFPPGPGTWPAFWLMSLQPAEVRPKIEIDVIEYYGHNTSNYFATSAVWYGKKNKHLTRISGTEIGVQDHSLTAAFHRYGVAVDPEHITYYLDGRPQYQQPTPVEHRAPLYPLVNLALGSGYSIEETPDPSTLEVDYVRVYKPRAKPAADCADMAETTVPASAAK